ncbi:MAG: divalent-cation tolerance protein CutA [Myxococcales bacterium]
MSDSIVVLVTAPDEAKAAEIGRALVEERLAACANIVPAIRSIYRWEGKVQDDAEVLMLLKTRKSAFGALEARVKALHPYTCPEIIALPIEKGHWPYLKWIAESVGSGT